MASSPSTNATSSDSLSTSTTTNWNELAERTLEGRPVNFDEALSILESHDDEILDVMAAAFQVRRQHFGKTVQLYFLMNAKSGLCPEDCSYCSQSKIATAEVPKYNILSREKLLDGARIAHERDAKTYCIVISARGPNDREMAAVTSIVPEIKAKFDLKICACLGLLTPEQAEQLRACGVDRVNHNLNTSREHYAEICSTHTYEDRINTLQAVREAGMELCSGGILGMGESKADIVRMALDLRELGVESIPVNFLNPIDGTPLSGKSDITPRDCLRTLAMFRFICPDKEIRIAGGREMHLGSLQALGLYAANSVFVGDYLTTEGQVPEADYRMIEEMGFDVTKAADLGSALPQS